MRVVAFLLIGASMVCAAQAQAPKLVRTMTTVEFAIQCQHPAMKPNPDARLRACIAFVDEAADALSALKSSDHCSTQRAKLSAGPVLDVLFADATNQKTGIVRAWDNALFALQVALPACSIIPG